ncbi:MAG: PKD domain-containing protein [Bacteroidetes bacterium]|nr:PKD domain-containing protein [Bacteroidota bacterium]
MNKLISLLTLLLAFQFVSAQNFLINEDFATANDTVPPSGWTNRFIYGDNAVDKCQFSTAVFNFAKPLVKNYAVFDSYNGGSPGGTATNSLEEEMTLISPTVSTSSVSNLTLSIDKQVFIQAGANAYIEVSTNGGSSWTIVWSQTSAIVEGTPSNLKINLDSYKGNSSFTIRFRWYNSVTTTYRGFFVLDNVQLYESKAIDVRVSEMVEMYDNSCPSANQSLLFKVYNAGTSTATNVPVVLKVGSNTYYDTVASIAAGATGNAFASQTISTSSGGTFDFSAYTTYASDQVVANDTLKSTRHSSPPPAVPSGGSVSQCGVGSATLTTNANSGDSTYWFLQASGGTDVGSGNPFVTPYLDKTTTFYVENSRATENSFTSSAGLYRFNAAPNGPGSMFDLSAKNEIIIDSISQHFAYAGTYIMNIYYKSGTYKGSEYNSGAWTKLDLVTDTLVVSGYGSFYVMKLKKPLRVPAGSTYGFYVDAQTTSITFTNGALDDENADVRIVGNTVLSDNFNGVLTGYYWNGQVFFRKTCSTGRKALTVNIKPRPKGVSLAQGSSFDGVYRAGTVTDFDIASEGRTIGYELQPPAGYSNADFGTKWYVSALDMTSINGTPIPTGDTTLTSPGSSNGSMTYTPSNGWEDSTVVITVAIYDVVLGCDTVIERHIFVAPAPNPNFEAPNVCQGASMEFSNKTTIASGFVRYVWYFGDGDSSTFENPFHTYAQYGTYSVKLVATSDYGIQSDTTIQVEVYEIPDVKFTVKNACEDVAVEFTNSTTISSGTLAFNWNFGDGGLSTLTNPTHTYDNPGGYQVTLVASANGCSNKLTKYANQFARPSANFSSAGGCVGEEVLFVNSSSIELGEKLGSRWNFDDGNLGTLNNPTHIFSTPGIKNVQLTSVSQFGCKDSVTVAVTIKPSPKVDFSYDKNCQADPVVFTNKTTEPSGATVIYTWDFGDGTLSTQKSPSHQYVNLGLHTIMLKAQSDNGCNQEISKEINILVQPVADFNVGSVCSGESVSFENKTKVKQGDVEYRWFFGDGDSSHFTSPVKIYNVDSTEIFVIKLIAKAKDGCEDVVQKNITIHQKPKCGYTVVQSKQDRRTFTFIPNDQSYESNAYTWIFVGSGVYNEKSPTHTFEYYDNSYPIILDITGDNGCSCYDSSRFLKTSWPLAIDEQELHSFRVYPNPSTGIISLKNTSDNASNLLVEVHADDGRLVASFDDLSWTGSVTTLNLNHLTGGVYYLTLNNLGLKEVHRIVLIR